MYNSLPPHKRMIRTESYRTAPYPVDEAERLIRLAGLPVTEGDHFGELDQIASLTARVLGTPVCFVSLVGMEKVWFLARIGLETAALPRDRSVCQHAILSDGVFAAPHLTGARLPTVGGMCSYLGAPILTGTGQSALGVLAVMDRHQRHWTPEEVMVLQQFADMVEKQFDRMGMVMAWQSAPLAMVLLDENGACVLANPALARLTGRSVVALEGSSLGSIILGADRQVFRAMLAYTLQHQESPTRRELRYARLSGEVVLGGTSMAPLRGASRQAICIIRDISLERRRDARSDVVAKVREELGAPIAALRALLQQEPPPVPSLAEGLKQLDHLIEARMGDIYARFQAEAALMASEQRLRTVVENLAGLIVVLDDRGRIVDLNAVALRTLEWEYDAILGQSLQVVQPDFCDATCSDWLRRCTERQEHDSLPMQQVKWIRKEGAGLRLELRWLMMDWNGPGRLVVIGHDVTEAQQRQALLEQERQVLEMRVQDRTDALTAQRKLEEELKRSISEKDTLLREIHHRVKNNLQIVSSLLRLQVDHMPAGRAQEMLTESVLRVRSMAMIHEQLYNSPSLEQVDLGAYTRRLVETLRYTLAPALRVTVRSTDIQVTVETAVPIGLMLNELVTNAFKYGTVPGTLQSEDVLVELVEGRRQLRLLVRDWGPGLPEGMALENSTSLGLKLVRTLSRQLKGTLELRNQDGAVFELTCPL